MTYAESRKKLDDLRKGIGKLRAEMRAIQADIPPEKVKSDYAFETPGGVKTLADLFGDSKDLIVVHNMGAGCSYCTLWADGYNGLYPHLADRASFVVVSPDPLEKQAAFAKSRGWVFPMASDGKSDFAKDMGYIGAKGGRQPGISVFQMRGKSIVRVSDTGKGPYDDFCALWHMFDMFPEGPAGWQPKYKYA